MTIPVDFVLESIPNKHWVGKKAGQRELGWLTREPVSSCLKTIVKVCPDEVAGRFDL